jgi:hypothetical protein
MDVYQRRRLVALSAIAGVFVLIVVVIATAGGDDEPEAPITTVGTTEQATTLPKQDYIEEADGICGEVNSALASVDTSDAANAASEELTLVAGELEQLQSLPPPDSDEAGGPDLVVNERPIGEWLPGAFGPDDLA